MKEIEQKKKAEADKAAHAEAMALKEAEEAERKRIADEQAAERKESGRSSAQWKEGQGFWPVKEPKWPQRACSKSLLMLA